MKSTSGTKSGKKIEKPVVAEKEGEENVLENFKVCIRDFTMDLSITFPEYHRLWAKWQQTDIPESDWEKLLEYCKKIYPERFFDLLYKNEEIFALPGSVGVSAKSTDEVVVEDVDSDEDEDAEEEFEEKREVNVNFLPAVDFKILYHCEGVTENTKESIWKYLQMVLFLIMKTVKSSAAFGETEDLFAGVDEKELQEQMKTTLENLAEFFQKSDGAETGVEGEGGSGSGEKLGENERPHGKGPTSGLGEMPDIDEINEHLKNLMGVKSGNSRKKSWPNTTRIWKMLSGILKT